MIKSVVALLTGILVLIAVTTGGVSAAGSGTLESSEQVFDFGHIGIGYIPFLPGSTVKPQSAVFYPLTVLKFINGREDGQVTNPVGPVGIAQVARSKNLMRFDLFHVITFEDVPDFDIIEILDTDAAFEALKNLFGVILESLQ